MRSTNEERQWDQQSMEENIMDIKEYIQQEIAFKQYLIHRLEYQLEEALLRNNQQQERIATLQQQLESDRHGHEGARQLINKLLNDIGNYQKDISWYKRTYEERSFLGILKDKFFRRGTPKQ